MPCNVDEHIHGKLSTFWEVSRPRINVLKPLLAPVATKSKLQKITMMGVVLNEGKDRTSRDRYPNSRNDVTVVAQDIHLSITKLAKRVVGASAWAKAILVIVGSAMAGLGQFIPVPASGPSYGPVIGVVGVFLAFVGAIWTLVVDRSEPQTLLRAHEAIELARSAKDLLAEKDEMLESFEFDLNQASRLYFIQRSLREHAETVIASRNGDLKASVQTMINIAARTMRQLMLVLGGEYWTLAVYQHVFGDNGKSELHFIAGERSEPQDDGRQHRIWGAGEGIAGHCFTTRKEVIIEDANDAGSYGWLHIPQDLVRNDDNRKYVSMVAIPVTVPYLKHPWGVVVATSDQVGRFAKDAEGNGDEDIEPLRMISGMVGLLGAIALMVQTLPVTVDDATAGNGEAKKPDAGISGTTET